MGRTNPALLSFAGQADRAKVVDLTRGFWVDAARVLPLGDSNTHGWDNGLPQDQWESYRADLWSLAANDGLWFDFVGPSAHGPSTLPDRDHHGVSGITSTEVVGRSTQVANIHQPDVVLLMLGTNDALRETNAASTVPGELLTIMRNIAAAQPDVTVLLAPLPPIGSSESLDGVRAAINDQLPGVVSQAKSFGIDARYVPIPDLTSADLTDGVHLSEDGHAKIAAAWYDALQASLSTSHGTFAGQRTPVSGVLNVQGSEVGDSLRGNSGDNTLAGRGGADRLDGAGGRDRLMGGPGQDRLHGSAGQDLLYAGTGSDRLVGGIGKDVLYGGQDGLGDDFVFASRSHSTVGSSRDEIHNFTRGADDIDLRGLDARASSSTDDAFLWGGKTASAHKVWWQGTSDGVLLRADVTGDRTADFEVLILGLTTFGPGDALL